MALQTPLPDLCRPHPLTQEDIAFFKRNGYVRLRGVCTPEELAPYADAIREYVKRKSADAQELEARDTYGKAFLQVMNIWEEDPVARSFVFGPRFAEIAAKLLEVEGVRLYHDQALFKEAGGGHTPWHQDQFYWPLATDNTVTMWIALTDIEPEMGPMRFAAGSHVEGYLGELPISDESEKHFEQYVAEKGFELTEPVAMKAGDATFHTGWTLHNAPPNRTDRVREAMTIIYFEDGVRISEPDNPNRQQDIESWLPGQKAGEKAESPLNPLLYP
jgi:ectoine hydroxylase-related dioxygenase (phytanoyl-CoA dioxygenase family)